MAEPTPARLESAIAHGIAAGTAGAGMYNHLGVEESDKMRTIGDWSVPREGLSNPRRPLILIRALSSADPAGPHSEVQHAH